MGGCVRRRIARRRRWGELAGLPELNEVFQAGEELGEERHDEGVQVRRQPAVRVVRRRVGAEAGDLADQWGGVY